MRLRVGPTLPCWWVPGFKTGWGQETGEGGELYWGTTFNLLLFVHLVFVVVVVAFSWHRWSGPLLAAHPCWPWKCHIQLPRCMAEFQVPHLARVMMGSFTWFQAGERPRLAISCYCWHDFFLPITMRLSFIEMQAMTLSFSDSFRKQI